MRTLVTELKECAPEEPLEPAGVTTREGGTTVTPVQQKKFDIEYKRYLDKLDAYKEKKSTMFWIIKGQCNLTMKNRLESDAA